MDSAPPGPRPAVDNGKGSPPDNSREPEADLTALKRKWAIRSPSDLKRRSAETGSADFLIDGLFPARSLGIVVGDSGLGKSPLLYQAALCVAAGVPFLGHEVRRGRVLYLDFENSVGQSHELVGRLGRHLGVREDPEGLFVWHLNDCSPNWGQPGHTALDMIREVRPALAIIDSLGSYDPELEEKNSNAGKAYKNFRWVMSVTGATIVCVHHRKKPSSGPGQDGPEPLEEANPRRWFQQARGASVLITGCDVRLGVDEPGPACRQVKGNVLAFSDEDKGALVMRGFGRVRGEIPPTYLARVFDPEDGEPLGYRQMAGADLLFNVDQENCFGGLPPSFTFKEAKHSYGRADQPTRDFLKKCMGIGILNQPAKGHYQKVTCHVSE
jgi:AAA domain